MSKLKLGRYSEKEYQAIIEGIFSAFDLTGEDYFNYECIEPGEALDTYWYNVGHYMRSSLFKHSFKIESHPGSDPEGVQGELFEGEYANSN